MIKKCLFKGSVDMEKVVAGRKVTCLPELYILGEPTFYIFSYKTWGAVNM